jgi:hypothetical protein
MVTLPKKFQVPLVAALLLIMVLLIYREELFGYNLDEALGTIESNMQHKVIAKAVLYRNDASYTAPCINIITVCQGHECMMNFGNIQQSLNSHGFNLHRLEVVGKFSWPKLATAYASYAHNNISHDALVAFVDSSDILAQGCPNQLIERFNRIALSNNRSILAGVESHCTNPRKCHKFKHMMPPASRLRPGQLNYLNGGFIMGKVGPCVQAWREIGRRFKDTQLGWGVYADEHPDVVAMDWNQEVVASNTAKEWDAHFTLSVAAGVRHKEVVVLDPATQRTASNGPVFVHVLCHTCQKDNFNGVGGPAAYQKMVEVLLHSNATCTKS